MQVTEGGEALAPTGADELMLDTNVFNAVVDGRLDVEKLAGRRLIITGVQAGELRKCGEPRRAILLALFSEIDPTTVLASSFMFGVEGAGFDQACWSEDPSRAKLMFRRLRELDRKSDRYIINQWSDVAIAETALKRGATLVSDDRNLRRLAVEFGARAIASADL